MDIERDVKLRKIRALMELRVSRRKLLGPSLFVDPDWEIMLRMFLAELEGTPVRTADLLAAVNWVPTSTLLRFLTVLEDKKHIFRTGDNNVQVLHLTEGSLGAMHAIFEILPGERLF